MANNKNEVFEYLIDQLRQQIPVVDVMGEIKRWSIDRSIAGRGNYTDDENAIIDAYIGLEHNPHKQQCEDLAHEVLSLKNQLRDASAQIKELHLALVKATGDAEAYKLIRKGGYIDGGKRYVVGEHAPGTTVNCRCTSTPVPPEQSGCWKEDAQECHHNWRFVNGKAPAVCINCGVTKADECKHANTAQLCKGFAPGFTKKCLDCGAKLK